MNPPQIALEPMPLAWIEAADLEAITFEKSTWIPLHASVKEFEIRGPASPGIASRQLVDRITGAVLLAQREKFKNAIAK